MFYVFHYNLKEKDHIRKKYELLKKEVFLYEISIFIILICQKFGLITPVQQQIKLSAPNENFLLCNS